MNIRGRNNIKAKKAPAMLVMYFLLTACLISPTRADSTHDYERKIVTYMIPEVTLVNQDGEKIDFKTLVHSQKLVILDFIYGTCTTICPVLSIGFSHFQKKLGQDASKVQLVSVSIDPDNDTPHVMKEYLARYNAQPGWDFLSGKRDNIFKIMKAFDAFISNKMDHKPLTFLHAPGSDKWVRVEQLLSTADLMKEYKLLQQ